MNIEKRLNLAHGYAEHMMTTAYSKESGFPITAASHPDFWPGDAARWVAGYLAIGNEAMAQGVMAAVGGSIRSDGGIPHYMLGSHMRLGGKVETNIVDRYVQVFSGNGMERSARKRWVTSIDAAPTAGIAAHALTRAGGTLPESISLNALLRAQAHITETRLGDTMLIEVRNRNELTNNSGALAKKLKVEKHVVDPAVNALYINNERALDELGLKGDTAHTPTYSDVSKTQIALEAMIEAEHSAQEVLSLESTLAAARLGLTGILRDNDLLNIFKAPSGNDKHPEQTRASLPDALEAARLTANSFEVSRMFLGRIVTKVAENGHNMIDRYEGMTPSGNLVANRAYRRQLWAPTAAEIRQLTADMID